MSLQKADAFKTVDPPGVGEEAEGFYRKIQDLGSFHRNLIRAVVLPATFIMSSR